MLIQPNRVLVNKLIVMGVWLLAMMMFTGCSQDRQGGKPLSQALTSPKFSNAYSEQIYQVLLAEYRVQRHDYSQASQDYRQLLATHAEASIAQRSMEVAIKAEDYVQALHAVQQWKAIQPQASGINQKLVFLFQANKDYSAAAKALTDVVKLSAVDASKGIDVAVALLDLQIDTEATYLTLKHYVSEMGSGVQQSVSDKATYYLGLFATRAKLFDEAVRVTEPVTQVQDIELQRKTALLRVKAHMALDKPDQAMIELKRLIAEAADPVTQQSYARLVASLGRTQEAVALLAQVYDNHPDKAELLLDMIAIQLGDKNYQQSLVLIDKLETLGDQRFNVHYYRGLVFESQQQFAFALTQYSVIEKDGEGQLNMMVFLRMVAVMQETKGLDNALAYLHANQKLDQSKRMRVDLHLLESDMLQKAGRYEEAIEANKQAEKLSPADLDIIYSQALLFEDLQQIDQSEALLHKILEVESEHTGALNALGYMLSVHTSRLDEAYRYIKKAYDLRPDDPAIIDSLGWVAYRKGDLDDAEHYLRLAYKKLQDPEVASHLVEVLSKQGRKSEATKVLQEMLEKHPQNKLLKAAQAQLKGE